jgi:hypothetical protein
MFPRISSKKSLGHPIPSRVESVSAVFRKKRGWKISTPTEADAQHLKNQRLCAACKRRQACDPHSKTPMREGSSPRSPVLGITLLDEMQADFAATEQSPNAITGQFLVEGCRRFPTELKVRTHAMSGNGT